MDCGPTCLQMVCNFYGYPLSINTIRKKCQINKTGVSLLGLSEAAESFGFLTRSVLLTVQQLQKEVSLPAILHWDQNHFVILQKIKSNDVYVADPAAGIIKYKIEELYQKWAVKESGNEHLGVALLLQPGPFNKSPELEEATTSEDTITFKKLLSYLSGQKKFLSQLLAGVVISSFLQLILPFLTQSIVDVGIAFANIAFINLILLAQLALFTGRIMVEFVRGWILLHISTRINVSIMTHFITKLMKLPIWYFDSKQSGDIVVRMSDQKRIETFLTGSSVNIFFSIVNLVVFCTVLFIYNISIALIFVLFSSLYACWIIYFLKRRRLLDHRRFDLISKEHNVALQLINGMQEIKLHGCEIEKRWEWESVQAKAFQLNSKTLSINQVQQAGAFFLNEGKNIIITVICAHLVISGNITLGTMLAIQYIVGQLNSPIEQMVGFIQNYQNAKLSMERLNEIHTMRDEEIENGRNIRELRSMNLVVGGLNKAAHSPVADESATPAVTGKIRSDHKNGLMLRSVSFSYPGAQNKTINGLSCNIPFGKTTAIVGMSGSGKTTLLKLLLKHLAPNEGLILCQGINLSEISYKSWRETCGAVLQDGYIFSDTISANVTVKKEDVDNMRVQQAIELANLSDYISTLPLGLSTKIGTDGSGLSMGQKQRILIARAIYKNPDILFFDEATNSLDTVNEGKIVRNMDHYFKNKTVIIVAHRLSTVRKADQIIVLHEGRVAESGTHEYLISNEGAYLNLIKNQLQNNTH